MRSVVTREMIREAQRLGLSYSAAGRHFGISPKTFNSAARRYMVALSKGKSGPDAADRASDTRIKAWSAKPSAIAKEAHRAAKIGAKP